MGTEYQIHSCTVVLGLLTQWIPTVDHCVLVKVGLLTPTTSTTVRLYSSKSTVG
eukprot:COSAG01_NODE_5886_length_3969_cov_90.316537_2_plen_54_part_00